MKRVGFLLPAGLLLFAGLAGGLMRLGALPTHIFPEWTGLHGPLMAAGFLGTLISLERAVGLGRAWAYGAPILHGAGGVFSAAGLPAEGAILICGGAVFFLAIQTVLFLRTRDAASGVMSLGGLCAVAASAGRVFGAGVDDVVLLWMGFLLFTIVGERLEMSRFTLRPGGVALAVFAGLFFPAAFVMRGSFLNFHSCAGASFLGFGLFLLLYDVARKTIRQRGYPRFAAFGILGGAVFLAMSGLIWIADGVRLLEIPHRDAALHTFFLGFTFSMIFAHGPMILPMILGRSVKFHPVLYFPLALLWISTALRILAGFLAPSDRVTLILPAGFVGAGSIVFFLLTMIFLMAKMSDSEAR